MPWDMNDYPDSFKNLNGAVKKKAIEISNAMIDDGYSEDRAIPIATEQAKKWFDNAGEEEIEHFKKHGKPSVRKQEDKNTSSNPELLDSGEHVLKHEDGWAVKAKGAKQPSDVFSNKDEAVKRAKEIAENKGTEAVIYKEDGTIQHRFTYAERN